MVVPAPPLPAVVTVIVSVAPTHTLASDGSLAMTGATGSATTFHDTSLTGDVLQPGPVAVRRL